MKKKIFFIILFLVLTAFIYGMFKTDKKTYLALGDVVAKGVNIGGEEYYSYNDYVIEHLKTKKILKKHYKDFIEIDLRTNDLINMIKYNYKLEDKKETTIQQALVKANYITLSIGSYDLYNHIGVTDGAEALRTEEEFNKYFYNFFTDLNELLALIKKYTMGEVIVIGFYNPLLDFDEYLEEIFDYVDISYKKIAEKNNCEYISLDSISGEKKYLAVEGSILINERGQKYIGEMIIKELNKS